MQKSPNSLHKSVAEAATPKDTQKMLDHGEALQPVTVVRCETYDKDYAKELIEKAGQIRN